MVLPHGHGHVVSDTPTTKPTRLERLVAEHPPDSGGRMRVPGRGAQTVLLCGGLHFEDPADHPLLAALPDVLHLKGRSSVANRWLPLTTRFLEGESSRSPPGADAIVTRLCDILFVEAVRQYFASDDAGRVGLTAAMNHPRLGALLTSIQRRPESDWDLATMASRCGMSRAAFAARFSQWVGEPPLRYVSRCRMDKAASLLRTSRAPLGRIAEQVGFTSEASFSRAFKKRLGLSPASFRQRSRSSTLAKRS